MSEVTPLSPEMQITEECRGQLAKMSLQDGDVLLLRQKGLNLCVAELTQIKQALIKHTGRRLMVLAWDGEGDQVDLTLLNPIQRRRILDHALGFPAAQLAAAFGFRQAVEDPPPPASP